MTNDELCKEKCKGEDNDYIVDVAKMWTKIHRSRKAAGATEREIGSNLFLNDFGGWIAQHK
jgi:hypothetical protein